MKFKERSKKSIAMTNSRWAAYATAGAATALGCATAENAAASIHYSGPINQSFTGSTSQAFQLDQPGNSITPKHSGASTFGAAKFYINGLTVGSIAGFAASGFQYVSKLASGVNVNGLANFVPGHGSMAFLSGYPNSQWLSQSTGFVGFKFDGGAGLQYGWARINMDSGTPGNTFTLIDFAYGDVGDQVVTGQIPEPGSLALLALGGAGLLAWRKRRSKALAA